MDGHSHRIFDGAIFSYAASSFVDSLGVAAKAGTQSYKLAYERKSLNSSACEMTNQQAWRGTLGPDVRANTNQSTDAIDEERLFSRECY